VSFGGLDAGGLRHPDVHQHHVGHRLGGEFHRLGAVGGLADQLDAVLFLQHHLQAPTEEGVVIGYEHPDRVGARLGLSALNRRYRPRDHPWSRLHGHGRSFRCCRSRTG
jgi:hypothetical protein